MIACLSSKDFFQCSTSLFIWLFLLFSADSLFAAEIVYVGRSFVIIDSGTDEGLKIGSEICFAPKDDGDDLCGVIKIVRKRLAGIKFGSEEVSRLKRGLAASSDDLDESVPHQKMSKKELKSLIRELREKPAPAAREVQDLSGEKRARVANYRVFIGWIISPIRSYRYNLPSYSLENELSGEEDLWTAKAASALSLFTLSAELAWITSADSAWAIGMSSEALTTDKVSSSYSATDSSKNLEGQIDASAVSLYLDWQKSFGLIEDLSFILRPGLAFEQSKIHVTETLNNGGDQLTKLDSQLNLLALRLGGNLLWHFSGIDWQIGLSLLLPFASKVIHTATPMTVNVDASSEQAANVDQALVDALDHTKAALGVQILLAAGWAF